MRRINKQQHAGFTLIETIVYVALFALIIGGAVTGAWHMLQGGESDLKRIAVETEGNFLMQKFLWALEGSPTNITASGGRLEFDNHGEHFNFRIAGGSMRLNGVPLSSSTAAIGDAAFARTPAFGGIPEHVVISFSVNNRPFGPFTTYVR